MLDLGKNGYRGITKVTLLSEDFYFLLSPESVREVVVEQAEDSFPDRFSLPLFTQLGLDRGIVYEQGERHRRQKRVCLPSFEQARSMDFFIAAIHSETAILAASWSNRLRTAQTKSILDVYQEARKLTLEVVLRVSFGLSEDFDKSNELSRVIGDYLQRIVATANEIPPLWQISPILSANYQSVTEDLLPSLRNLVTEVIAQRRKMEMNNERASKTKAADLLGVLLQAEGVDDDDILAILFDLVIAGSDTAASTITATLWLIHSPLTPHTKWSRRDSDEGIDASVLDSAQSEIAAAVNYFTANSSSTLSKTDVLEALAKGLRSVDDIQRHLPFMTACVRETLRLYPPVPFIGRRSIRESSVTGDVLDSDSVYSIPNCSVMCWSPYFLGRDPRHWQVPVDSFRPTRWLSRHEDFYSPSTGLPRSPYCWLPFGAGPRGCLGTRLGMNEAILASTLLLFAFDFDFGFEAPIVKSPGAQSNAPGIAEARKIADVLGFGPRPNDGKLRYTYDLTLNLEGSCLAAVSERHSC